jgi:hypothetical protein
MLVNKVDIELVSTSVISENGQIWNNLEGIRIMEEGRRNQFISRGHDRLGQQYRQITAAQAWTCGTSDNKPNQPRLPFRSLTKFECREGLVDEVEISRKTASCGVMTRSTVETRNAGSLLGGNSAFPSFQPYEGAQMPYPHSINFHIRKVQPRALTSAGEAASTRDVEGADEQTRNERNNCPRIWMRKTMNESIGCLFGRRLWQIPKK